MLQGDLTRPHNYGFPSSESSPDSFLIIVMEFMVEPSIFPISITCSMLSAIFTTSCTAELELSSQWGWFRRRPMHQVVISWWLKALLLLFMTEKKRCSFNWTWTSSVPTKDCANILVPFNAQHLFKPFNLMLNTYSNKCESSYLPVDALRFLLTMSLALTPFFISHHLFSIRGSKAYLGDPTFNLVHAWQMYKHIIYMRNSPFEGWHMVITLAWWTRIFILDQTLQ